MSSYTAQDLEALRRQAEEIEKVLNAPQAAQEESYRQQQAALETQRENALRQAYITQQQTLAQLPQYMANNGINGGLAESSMVQLGRAYGNQRSDIQSQYDQNLQSLQLQQNASQADWTARRAQDKADYLGAYSAVQAQQQQQEQQLALQQAQLAQQQAQQQQWEKMMQQMSRQTGRSSTQSYSQPYSQTYSQTHPPQGKQTDTMQTKTQKKTGFSSAGGPQINNRVNLIM